MVTAGLVSRTGVLPNPFNARYWGRSVSLLAVSRWLRGQAILEQGKLLVVAEIVNVQPEVLRFGGPLPQADQKGQTSRRARPGSGVVGNQKGPVVGGLDGRRCSGTVVVDQTLKPMHDSLCNKITPCALA